MSERKILPCPFCGGEATMQTIPPHTHEITKWMPQCNGEAIIECKCGCSIMRDTEEEAIAAWNTRKPIEKVVEQLEDEKHFWEGKHHDQRIADEKAISYSHAIEIVKQGCVGTDDVCEWKQEDDNLITSCGDYFNILDNCTEKFDFCPKCGKKIKVVE